MAGNSINASNSGNSGYLYHRVTTSVKVVPPYMYGFVVTVPEDWYQHIAALQGKIQLMKVGCTHTDATPETGNGMEKVKKELKEKYGDGVKINVVFKVPIRAVNIIHSREVNNIREKIGIPVPEDLAESFDLPVPSEWVFTSNSVIKALMHENEKFEHNAKLSTDIFDNFSYWRFDTSSTNLDGSVKKLLKQLKPEGPCKNDDKSHFIALFTVIVILFSVWLSPIVPGYE